MCLQKLALLQDEDVVDHESQRNPCCSRAEAFSTIIFIFLQHHYCFAIFNFIFCLFISHHKENA